MRVLITSLATAVVAVTGVTLTAHTADAATQRGTNSAWSGVVNRLGGFTTAAMSFRVPAVSARCGPAANAAIWSGLGGYGSFPFAQNGIAVTPAGVSAWYELFDQHGNGPVVGVVLRNKRHQPVGIRAGDGIALSLQFLHNHTQLRFTWIDRTRHASASVLLRNAARWYNGRTADFIVEHSAVTPGFARFTPISITDAYAVRGGRRIGGRQGPAVTELELAKYGHEPMDTITHGRNDSAFKANWRYCA